MKNSSSGKEWQHNMKPDPQRVHEATSLNRHPLNRERILEIRSRITSGFYDQPAVQRVCAHRILQAGDLNLPA